MSSDNVDDTSPNPDAGELAPAAISIKDLCKNYISIKRPAARLWEIMSGQNINSGDAIVALEDVSFELKKGERLGIVGENGSGKSTLLKIISGVLSPSSGTAAVKGRVSALLELGAGFNAELSGRDNIIQFCRLHGLSAEESSNAISSIIEFSELGDTIEQPLRSYSSGQGLRLGFACAVHVKPDVLIIDEALSVGDAYFQIKCLNKIRSMLDEGVTFLYVTHEPNAVRALCNRGLWLENGRVRMIGNAKEVSEAYQADMFRRVSDAGLKRDFSEDQEPDAEIEDEASKTIVGGVSEERASAFIRRVSTLRTGSGELRIDDVEILDSFSTPTIHVPFESELNIRIHFSYLSRICDQVDIGVGIADSRGVEIIHHSLASIGRDAREIGIGKAGVIDLRSKNVLCPGQFSVNVGANTLVSHPTLTGQKLVGSVFDLCIGAAEFEVQQPRERSALNLWGIVRSEFKLEIQSARK